MADIVVKGLNDLSRNLGEIISQFKGALDLENGLEKQWGQHNANLSMGDFADNWTGNRDKMVEDLEKFKERIDKADEAWTEGDLQLFKTLQSDGEQ
ncbi:hypothetical protein [Actinoplanes couchii]|nr:hypothetical protein [Actinoplanes couchii]MDR6322927.1 hypothetical protein [Actinoplanes couchii]